MKPRRKGFLKALLYKARVLVWKGSISKPYEHSKFMIAEKEYNSSNSHIPKRTSGELSLSYGGLAQYLHKIT